ncbi:MAG: protein kinase [Deltaproteobacteria bacterium]|nr:protein kinase [Deltaproteobacteria bacterium]
MRQVGQYAVVCRLASGELGDAYLARTADAPARPGVAGGSGAGAIVLKVIRLPTKREQRDQFLRESAGGPSFQHPAAARVLEMFTEGGEFFVAMELIAGQSFESLIARMEKGVPVIPPRISVWAVSELIAALDACHARGIPYRPISARHVMLGYDGRVAMLGAGLSPIQPTPKIPKNLAYWAPELLDHEAWSEKTAMFALGVLLTETLTGTSPFCRDSIDETRTCLQSGVPKLSDRLDEAALAPYKPLILQLIAKDPADRPSNLIDVRTTLRETIAAAQKEDREETRETVGQIPAQTASLMSELFAAERSAHTRLLRYALNDSRFAPKRPARERPDDDFDAKPTLQTARVVRKDLRADQSAETADMQSGSSGEGFIAGEPDFLEALSVHRVGRYLVRRLLRRSATHVLLEAISDEQKQVVLLKLRSEVAQGEQDHRHVLAEEIFLREADIVRRISHPAIPSVLDAGHDANHHLYIVYPSLAGMTLEHRMTRGAPLSLDEARTIVGQIADALASMHDAGYLHCGIKPQNINIQDDGTVVLSDFSQAAPLDGPLHPQLARDLFVLSPEFLMRDIYSPASDQFALGTVFYELLTGTRPFRGLDDQAYREAIVSKSPKSPTELDSRIDPLSSAIVLRMLAKDPAARFASCREIHRAFSEAQQHA